MSWEYIYVFLTLIFVVACSSSRQQPSTSDEYPNIVKLVPAAGQKAVDSNIYVDSVKIVDWKDKVSLLIEGNFPNGCTHIGSANHSRTGNEISLSLKPWRNRDQICTQTLTSFSFIYQDIPETTLVQLDSIQINGINYLFNH